MKNIYKILSFIVAVFVLQFYLQAETVAYTSSGSFLVPPGVTSIQVEVYGGGGGGGGSGFWDKGGSGGGGGAYVIQTSYTVTPGDCISFTIGAGGSGGGGNGSNGGETSFNNVIKAGGGFGGQKNGGSAGAGGSTGAGGILTNGNVGSIGSTASGGTGGDSGGSLSYGNGGHGRWYNSGDKGNDGAVVITYTKPAFETPGNCSWIGYVFKTSSDNSINFTGYIGTVTESKIFDRNFGTGAVTGTSTSLCGTAPTDKFHIRYKMQCAMNNAVYVLTAGGDDGYRLRYRKYPSGTWSGYIVSDWNTGGYRTNSSSNILFDADVYEFELDYFEDGGGARVSFNMCEMAGGNLQAYGSGNWRVYDYNSNNYIFNVANYRGTFTTGTASATAASFGSLTNGNVASASNTTGGQCGNSGSGQSIRAQLNNSFTSGVYNVTIGNDDNYRISFDGGYNWHYSGSCCGNQTNFRILCGNTNVVYQGNNGGGGGASYNASISASNSWATAISASACAISGYRANWYQITNATGYYIDVATDNSFSNKVVDNQYIEANNYFDLNLPDNATYYYRVRAYIADDCGGSPFTSDNSNTITATIPAINNDYIANAKYLGVLNAAGTTLSSGWDNNIGSTQETGETLHPDNESSNETDWLYFTTGSTPPSTVYITGEESDWLDLDWRLYKLNDNSYVFPRCGVNWSKLTYIIDGDGVQNVDACTGCLGGIFATSNREVSCLEANSTYYIVINGFLNDDGGLACGSCDQDQGNYKIDLDPYNAIAGVDNICSVGVSGETVGNLGTYATYTGSDLTFTRNNHSNRCATTQANEPSGGQKTTWYSFTTGATVAREFYFEVNATGGDMDAEVYVYEACNPLICTGSVLNAGELSELANYWKIPIPFSENDADGTLTGVIKPNTTYYVRVDGLAAFDVDGIYNLTVRQQGGTFNGNDDFCNAYTAGNATQIAGSTESITNNDILDKGETIFVNTFNNKAASTQEQCALDEPNVDTDDETVWIKFTTSATPGSSITIDAEGNNGTGGLLCTWTSAWIRVYVADGTPALPASCAGWTSSTDWFQGITAAPGDFPNSITVAGTEVGDESYYRISCPLPNTTYYIQLDDAWYSTCDMMDFTINITDNGVTPGPDKICNAIDLGTVPYGGPLSNTTNTDLFINNQTNSCATIGAGEPDAFPAQDVDKTVWYKFTTPAAYYPSSNPLAQLPHVYTFELDRLDGALLAWPTIAIWEQTAATTRTCSPENTVNSFGNLSLVDYSQNLNFGDVDIEHVCLKPNTTYYIQVDHATVDLITPGDDYVDFSLRVKKSAYRAADNLCDAVDLGIITQTGTAAGTPTNVNWTNSGKFAAAPFFSLPHTNKCTGAENGENEATGPYGTNTSHTPITGGTDQTASTWYKFTTGNTVPDWIYWYNNDAALTDGNRGSGCVEVPLTYTGGIAFNTEVTFLLPPTPSACPVTTQLKVQPETNVPGDLCEASTGLGFGAPCYNDLFRLKCPTPNTTYYVQIKDAGTTSLCYEGIWEFDDSDYGIKTAPTLGGGPINDSICNAIDLGTVPNLGTLIPTYNMGNGAGLFDNFCATPDYQWRADFTVDAFGNENGIEADVWFRFKPPLSGSVLITAQSAPSGSPSVDDDLDLQVAIWEPILGDGTNDHCDDPRYLWTPIVAQDHGIQEAIEAGFDVSALLFYYDIYETCGNSALCNEGNSLYATCLDPNKYYYIQVDGGDYLGCDFLDFGDCVMGYFKLQVKDAGLSLVNPDATATNISPYTALGVRNYDYLHDEPCFAYTLPVQPSATSYASLNWTKMTNRCATSITDPLPATWAARNSSTDKTVWTRFIAPPSGKVKIRAENINQIKGNADYHESINLQLAVYQTTNCFDKWRLEEINKGFGFDGWCIENDLTSDDDYVGFCLLSDCGFDEYMVVSCLVPGQEYYIMIDGDASYVSGSDFEDVEGDFRISVQEESGIPASTNDDLCDAATISGVNALAVNGSVTTGPYNNECATTQPEYESAGKIAEKISDRYKETGDILFHEFKVQHSLWFKFQAPASGKVRIEALEDKDIDDEVINDIDLGVAVYDIPSQNCAQLQSNGFAIIEDYDPKVTSGDEDFEVHCLVPNRWYWVQVDGDYNTICGPLTADLCGDPLRDTTGRTGFDCETGQFRVKITHLAADPTYADNVDYTVNPDLPGGNDNYCEAHRVKSASGSINIFSNATYLQNGETITFRHNNRCATTEINEPELNGWDLNPFNSDNTPTVWYAFNTGPILPPLLPGEITINVTNPSGTCFDPDMDLYEYTGALNSYYTAAGCTNLGLNKFNRLFRVGEGTNVPYLPLNPRHERITLTCPKPMTTYLIRVAGSSTCPLFGNNMGDFDMSISMSATPGLDVVNDDICNARNMGTLSAGGNLVRNLENNFCATQQQNEPNTDQDCVQSEACADETVWFKFKTSATPGDVQIVIRDILSNGYIAAPQIAVYRYTGADNSCTANPFNGLAKLDENTGVVVLAGVTLDSAKVSIPCARANTWYYVQVDGIDMSLLGFTLPGSSDNFIFNLQVRDLGNFSKRASNDNLVNALPIDSTVTAPGLYVLPAGGTKSRYGHNVCATCENNEDGDYCGTDETGHTASFSAEDETVWFYFTTSDNPGVTTITVADNPSIAGTFSPNFTLYYYNESMGNPTYRVTNAPSRNIIQEGSSSTGASSTSASFTCLLPNTRYLVQVDGNDNVALTTDQGDFIITVSDDNTGNPGPSNDLICSADSLSTAMASAVSRTNKCAWEETGEPNTSSNMGGTGDDVTSNDYDETVWFSFVPDQEQSVRLQLDVTSGMTGGINYVLYEMSSTSSITCTGTPADIPTWTQLKELASGSSTLLVGNEIDETWPCLKLTKRYYIQVDGNDLIGAVDVGSFNIQLTRTNQATPVQDDICGIGGTIATGNFGTFTTSTTRTASAQNNTCATQQLNEPETNGPMDDITDGSYDHTLWYKFVASNTDGTYNISVTNAGAATDLINAYIGVWREDNTTTSPVCPSTTWSNMTQIKESNNVDLANNETLSLSCWEIEEGKTYYVQVQGIDGILGGDVGNNFSVAVQFVASTTNPADNICTAPTANIGTTYNADNRCATTQVGEPNIEPSPQDPSDNGLLENYDETLWYKFVAPASGEVRLSLSNFSVPLLLSVNMQLYEAPTGYNCATSGFTGLIPNESSGFLTSGLGSTDFRCLSPGKTYYIQFDGNDALTDKGTWDFVITNLYVANTPPVNDEPCGAIDVTTHVRDESFGPCSADGEYYTNSYSVVDLAVDIDQATKTATAVGCDGELNCNDYWFKFTVPSTATGIRIQGNDEYGALGINNSDEHIAIYRAPAGCGGALQQVNCGSGGTFGDVDMTVAAFPNEVLYVQVFNADAPTTPDRTSFGFCISVDCPAKDDCSASANLSYDAPQCWNMNTNGADILPIYYDCLYGDNNTVNYFTFQTDCDGTPVDTVQLIFSVTDLGCGQTAMSMVRDNTPCTADYQEVIVNCAVFEEVMGGTTATNFNQTYIFPACTKYVVQIISDENVAGCASSGQILIVKGTSPTTVLPIELLSFTGYNDGAVNVLNWTTASERNSLKFEVEKSYDASNFEYIGEKLAAGNSSINIDYNFIDENPKVGNNYYRLKMIDADGTFKYSEIINIRIREDNLPVKDGIVKIYPNPTNGLLNIQYQSSKETDLDLNVYDVAGKNMLSNTKKVVRGLNMFEIDALNFAKGMYILNLLDKVAQENHQAKFIKE